MAICQAHGAPSTVAMKTTRLASRISMPVLVPRPQQVRAGGHTGCRHCSLFLQSPYQCLSRSKVRATCTGADREVCTSTSSRRAAEVDSSLPWQLRAEKELWQYLKAATCIASIVLLAGAAEAAAGYNPEAGDSVLKNVAGAAYVALVVVFFYRLLTKRAKTGTTQSFRTQRTPEEEEAAEAELLAKAEAAAKGATPLGAFWGAAQAAGFCFLLFSLCGYIDGYFGRQELPDQYTARNITVTLRTVVRGLAYLMTFIFGANAVGLTGLGVQLLFFQEQEKEKQQGDAGGDAGE